LKLNANDYVSELSGGNQRRASLAKALCQDADLLLLDEPTNHLDISSIEWLEKYLASSKCASIIISHDREFLRRVTDHTIWIDRGDVYVNNKGYIAYDEWSSIVIEEEINKLRKMEKELEKENLCLAQGVNARRKRNQQRF
jgi:ATP-binding cassette subfamily F protein uup